MDGQSSYDAWREKKRNFVTDQVLKEKQLKNKTIGRRKTHTREKKRDSEVVTIFNFWLFLKPIEIRYISNCPGEFNLYFVFFYHYFFH